MAQYYSGKFIPKNISKYDGDWRNIRYRSLWERQALKWLDENPNVISYSSEETIIPYICATDGKVHRYFVDLKIKVKSGQVYLIEIKPESQTIQPKKKRMSPKYLTEVMTWAKNESKWKAATEYCKDRKWIFEIWTEKTLSAMGIKILIKDVVKSNTIKKTRTVKNKIAKKKV
jgi:hypothetical protein